MAVVLQIFLNIRGASMQLLKNPDVMFQFHKRIESCIPKPLSILTLSTFSYVNFFVIF